MGPDIIPHRGRALGLIIFAALIAVVGFAPSVTAATSLDITLDATDITRKIVHSTTTIPAGATPLAVYYPKWIPGHHGPTGPIENMGGFSVTDNSGTPVAWERDYAEPYRFIIDASPEQYPINIALTYICNPSASDCSATPSQGLINWTAVSVYPEGPSVRDIRITPRLILPTGWKYATAMPTREVLGDTVIFETVTYEKLLDYPILCGKYLKTVQLESTPAADYFVHVAADEDVQVPFIDSVLSDSAWSNLPREAEAMFGRTHFDAYHFLVPISDSIPHYGLEHRNSSTNSLATKALTDPRKTNYSLKWLLPHEFAHSWCGKYRRPAGMCTPNYHTPKDMELLWVYEGLTTYLGMVLYARAGLLTPEYFKEEVAEYFGELRFKTGRQWRSLRDIAVSTYTVWGGSDNWLFLRRSADYYPEGAMLWLEIDARIREASEGTRSLDDFCRAFFGNGDINAHSVPYDRQDLVSALADLADYNWDSLITVRISGVADALDETPLKVAGYAFGYTDTKPTNVTNNEVKRECHYYYESIGLAIANDQNKVLQIVPGSPADAAGLCTGMIVIGVNGKTFSNERLDQALTDARETGSLTLLIRYGELLNEYVVQYSGGVRYLELQPLPDRTAWLDAIIRPVSLD